VEALLSSPTAGFITPDGPRLVVIYERTCQKKDLPVFGFVLQSILMDPNWAAEHLQVIRTIMERAAVYRRALAPIMIVTGSIGVLAGIAGWLLRIQAPQAFIGYWAGVAVVALILAFVMVRRQALREAEPFWSPPTRRVAQALLAPLFVGSVFGVLGFAAPASIGLQPATLPSLWVLLYGCALTAAGFFMQRGIKLLGWLFIFCGCALMARFSSGPLSLLGGHQIMGGVFGGFHLAYGIYLYFTEQRREGL
jgi:hypothetical protein